MRVTLIRHAEVEKRYQGCYNGVIDIALSDDGYKQAKKLCEKLKSCEYDAIYCSDLIRSKETLNQLNISQNIIYTDKLREKSWGRHEGLSYDEIVKKEGVEYIDFLQWISLLDGERISDYIKKVADFR